MLIKRWKISQFDQLPSRGYLSDIKEQVRNYSPVLIVEDCKSIENVLVVSPEKSLDDQVESLIQDIWGEDSNSIITNMLAALSVQSFDEYFTNPNKFFKLHLKKYSRTRRQAPIYLPLQSNGQTYTFWLYYHLVSDDTLYHCLNNQVEPEISRLEYEISQSSISGNPNRVAGRYEDILKSYLEELKQFRDDVLGLAPLWKPEVNDGALITLAPLWRLFHFPAWRSKLRATYEELENGNYDWSVMAYNLWPENVIRTAYRDYSVAVAHELDSDLWEVVKGRGKKLARQPKEISEIELNDYIQRKIAERIV